MHRTRVNECIVIDDGHTVADALVHVCDIADMVTVVIVINVGDLGDVHASVGHVHVLHVARTGPVPGHKYFSWTQRKPSHTATNTHSHAETSAANECHQSWCVHGSHC